MQSDRVRVVVVGCGFAGQEIYLPEVAADERCELVAVSDTEATSARQAAERFGIERWSTQIGPLLDEIRPDLVVNVTPPQSHAEVTRMSLGFGCHVYSEKPIATSVTEGRVLLAAAKDAGCHLVVAPDLVLRPAVRGLRRALASGQLGTPVSVNARYGAGLAPDGVVRSPWYYLEGGGALTDLGSYIVTAMVALFGRPQEVSALLTVTSDERMSTSGPFGPTAEDTAIIALRFASSVTAAVQTSYHFAAGMKRLQFDVCGGSGAARLRGMHWYDSVPEISLGAADWQPVPAPADEEAETGFHHTVSCIVGGRRPEMTGDLALHVLEVLEAARMSDRTGTHVRLDALAG